MYAMFFFIQKYHTLVIQILVKTAPSVKNSKVGNTIVSARQVPAVNTVKVRNRSRDVRFNSLYVKSSLNFIRLLRVVITPSVTSESTGR